MAADGRLVRIHDDGVVKYVVTASRVNEDPVRVIFVVKAIEALTAKIRNEIVSDRYVRCGRTCCQD